MRLSIAFAIALFFACFGTALFPALRLFPFAPFLILALYRKPLLPSLWLALACGLILDLLTTQYTFGLFSLGSIATTLLLYKLRWNIYADKPFSLPLFSALFSIIATLVHLLLLAFFGESVPRSAGWIALDTLLMALVDAAYAFAFFTAPVLAYTTIRKRIILAKVAKEE